VTNAIRHGQASSVHIALSFELKQLVMQVSNNGTLPHKLENTGSGIKGMEERTQLLGGQLKVVAEDCFVVTTILPNHQVDA
jgi:two-component system NarL family sensor kinase